MLIMCIQCLPLIIFIALSLIRFPYLLRLSNKTLPFISMNLFPFHSPIEFRCQRATYIYSKNSTNSQQEQKKNMNSIATEALSQHSKPCVRLLFIRDHDHYT